MSRAVPPFSTNARPRTSASTVSRTEALPRLDRPEDVGDRAERHVGEVERRVERALDGGVPALGRLLALVVAAGSVVPAPGPEPHTLAGDLDLDRPEAAVRLPVRRARSRGGSSCGTRGRCGRAPAARSLRSRTLKPPVSAASAAAALAALARLREPRPEVAELRPGPDLGRHPRGRADEAARVEEVDRRVHAPRLGDHLAVDREPRVLDEARPRRRRATSSRAPRRALRASAATMPRACSLRVVARA